MKTAEQTVDDINNKATLIIQALELLSPLTQRLKLSAQLELTEKSINSIDLITEIKEFKNEFNMSVVSYIGEPELKSIIESGNFIASIEDLFNRVIRSQQFLAAVFVESKSAKKIFTEFKPIMESVSNILIDSTRDKVDHSKCSCGDVMMYSIVSKEFECKTCGAFLPDNETSTGIALAKTKITGETDRHYKSWMRAIQGQCAAKISSEDLVKVKTAAMKYIKFSYEQVRCILRECGLEKYNSDVPFFMKELTGISPPQFTFDESEIIYLKYKRMMELYDQVKNVEINKNRPYYPFFIQKAIEIVFADNPNKLRALNYIHIQSQSTIIKNDKLFEQICKISSSEDGFIYKPTNYIRD